MRFSLFLVAFVFAGCSASGAVLTPAQADAALGDARAAVAEAQQLGAERAAPAELRAAQARLADAERVLSEGDPTRATHLAREAAVSAELAGVAALAQRAREAQAIYEEVQALRAVIEAE